MARYAADHESEFHRIEAVADVAGALRVLDLTDEEVRAAVGAATDTETLYRVAAADLLTRIG